MADLKKILISRALCAALAMAGGVAAYAQEDADASLEVTIRLLPENAVGPEELTRRIELPPAAATVPRAAPDAGNAPGQRNENPGRGAEISNEARERGREFGQEVSEQARGNRENAGRPDDGGPPDNRGRPDDAGPPDDVGPPDNAGPADNPGPPDTPGPPDNPGRPDDAGPPNDPPRGPPITPPGQQ
jgi:hypothetical protein